jgi:hypothetical protein
MKRMAEKQRKLSTKKDINNVDKQRRKGRF